MTNGGESGRVISSRKTLVGDLAGRAFIWLQSRSD